MFLHNKRFIAATLTFIIAAMSLSSLPITAAAESDTSKYLFYDDFATTPEEEYFKFDNSKAEQDIPSLSRVDGKLQLGRGTSASSNWSYAYIPPELLNSAAVTDTDKFIIEWYWYQNINKYPANSVNINTTKLLGTYGKDYATLEGVYYVMYDRKAHTADYYYPNCTEPISKTGVAADGVNGFTFGLHPTTASAGKYNFYDYIKIYPYYGMDAAISYKNEGGAEPNSVNIVLSDEFAQADDITDYITVDGKPVLSATADADNPLLYTVTFADTLDFKSEHTLSIAGVPSIMYQTFSKELTFKVRDRGLFTNFSLKGGSFEAGATKIVADIANETELTGNLSLIAAVYSADGIMKAFDEFTLSSVTGATEFDFTIPTVEEGDTMEIFAASSLSALDIIGTKTIYTEEGVSYEKASAVEAVSSTAIPVCNATDLYEEITVALPDGAADRYVSLVVLTSGSAVAKNNIYYLANKKTENGVATFEIKMADTKATHSYIWHSQGETAHTDKSFTFYPNSFMVEGLGKINGAKQAEVEGYMDTYAEALGIVVPEESDSVLDYAYYALAALRDETYPESGFPTSAEASETFETALFIARKGSGETGKFIEEFNEKYTFDEKVYGVYSDALSGSSKGGVHSAIEKGKAYDIVSVKELFTKCVVLDGNKNAENFTQTKQIIEKLHEIIGLDMTAYNKLSGTKKSTVAQALTQKSYDDFDGFSDAFDDACEAAANSGGTSGGGLGGGGGFGGGGKTSSTAATTGGVFSDDIAQSNTDAKKFSSFNDMEGYEWAIDAVEDYLDKGIINGKDKNSFAPADNVTRAEIAKILALALELEAGEKDEPKAFGDVLSNHWAYEYVTLLSGKGIINGVEEGVFGTDMPLTRQMLVTILYRAAGEPEVVGADEFADMKDADDYAKTAMKYYKIKGAIEGVGNNKFLPQANISRAEAVVMVSKCLAVK